jgi:hypothetical protein
MHTKFAARIERRTWYVNGKYLGNKAPFVVDADGTTAQELTGDFYGEWVGTRHFDGKQIIADAIAKEISDRAMAAKNHPDSDYFNNGERSGFPIRLKDWGEYRVVTFPVAA